MLIVCSQETESHYYCCRKLYSNEAKPGLVRTAPGRNIVVVCDCTCDSTRFLGAVFLLYAIKRLNRSTSAAENCIASCMTKFGLLRARK